MDVSVIQSLLEQNILKPIRIIVIFLRFWNRAPHNYFLKLNFANKKETFCWVGISMPLLKIILERLVLAPGFRHRAGCRNPCCSVFPTHRASCGAVTSVCLSALPLHLISVPKKMFTAVLSLTNLWVFSHNTFSCVWSWRDVIKDEILEPC